MVVFRSRPGRQSHRPRRAPTTAPRDARIADRAGPVVSDELTTDQLYKEARKAMSENRMASPAGNNALEFYLKIVAKQPDDSGAKDALRELFPFATGTAEDQINQGAFDEANRIIALLAQADPSNYSLTILRSKLDAKSKLADREQQQAAARRGRRRAPQHPEPPRRRRRRNDAATPAAEGARRHCSARHPRRRRRRRPKPPPRARRRRRRRHHRHPRHQPAATARRAMRRSRVRPCPSIRSPPRAIARKAGSKSNSRSRRMAPCRTRA